ncbi:MAG: hypothetical protein Q4G43_15085 [Mobilicoccus sp.]|nr:hypothetical protein [Mobilicoccus sp.]
MLPSEGHTVGILAKEHIDYRFEQLGGTVRYTAAVLSCVALFLAPAGLTAHGTQALTASEREPVALRDASTDQGLPMAPTREHDPGGYNALSALILDRVADVPDGALGGFFIDREAGVARVMATPRYRSDIERRLSGLSRVEVHTVPHSLRDLDRVKERIFQRADALSAHGVTLGIIDADEENNLVYVEVESGSLKAASNILRGVAGAIPVKVTKAEEPPPTRLVSRVADVSPWNSGSMIDVAGGLPCTSGPPAM